MCVYVCAHVQYVCMCVCACASNDNVNLRGSVGTQ